MNKNKIFSLNSIVKIGILSAISYVLMFIQLPIPIAPPFMKVDLADVPALLGGFAGGPLVGVIVQLIKNVLNLTKTTTAGVGELSNFIVGATFVFVAASVYRKRRNKKNAIVALVLGVLAMTVIATLSNAFVVFPAYGKAMKLDMMAFVEMTQGGNGLVSSYFTLMLLSVAPFNIIKASVASLVTYFLYKRVSPLLKK